MIRGAVCTGALLVAAGCGSSASSAVVETTVAVTTTTETAPPSTTVALVDVEIDVAVDQRPTAATEPAPLADQIATAEAAVRDPDTEADDRAAFGHLQQVAYAALAARPEWDAEVLESVPDHLHVAVEANLSARRTSKALLPTEPATDLPAWRIIAPESAENLLGYYREAETQTGIEWEYLAAINLMETRMGRIIGDSSAGAQGPMQFLPTTWAGEGIGEGDIYDPADAVAAAARYLVRRGGPDDMATALYGYNNSDSYVNAVEQYATVLRDDPRAYHGYHEWQVYYATAEGTVWLQEGYDQTTPIPAVDYLAAHPEAAPNP
ncbi:MAG: transglycosylase SLT domain-containing protein [Acidimicrobiales bacterium]